MLSFLTNSSEFNISNIMSGPLQETECYPEEDLVRLSASQSISDSESEYSPSAGEKGLSSYSSQVCPLT